MSKNLIYTIAVDHSTSTINNQEYSQYCINSWKAWCVKNDIDFLVIDKHNDSYKFPHWNKYSIFDKIGDKYDKLIMVDSDTMIKWNAPNPFNLYSDKFRAVIDRASLAWILRSMDAYGKFFKDIKLDIDNYFNSGVLFFTKKHRPIFEKLKEFYLENKSELDIIKGVGKDQTILNYILKQNNIEVEHLPPIWNLFSIHKKDMFKYNWQLKEDMTPFFIKYAYVWHFTGFSIEDRVNIMKQVWNQYKDNYA